MRIVRQINYKGCRPMKTILLWALTLFMFASAVFFIPSVASVLMLLFAAICAPSPRVVEFWSAKGLTGPLKIVLLIVLFAVCVSLVPV